MKIEKISLRNFRNIEECSLVPDTHLNLLLGLNGQGKTSIIEAIGYLSTLRSFRGAKTEEIVRWGQSTAEIQCTISSGTEGPSWRTELKIVFDRGEKASKTAFINGKPYRSSTQFLSQRFGQVELGFHSIVFNPADHELVTGEPSVRRAYLNRALSAEEVTYLRTVQKYQRTVDQRNAVLKADGPIRIEVLRGFNEQLVVLGSQVALSRLEWLSRLRDRLADTARQIAPRQAFLSAFYLSQWAPEIDGLSLQNNKLVPRHFTGLIPLPSLELLQKKFWEKLAVLEEAEVRARSCLVGPHRDDWAFFLGDQVLKGHGSQGEVRSALLALKLSEIDLFRKKTGHRPLLLLDDFSSELDQERRNFLLEFLMRGDLQVFVTTTADVSGKGKRFEVSNGKVREVAEGLSLK